MIGIVKVYKLYVDNIQILIINKGSDFYISVSRPKRHGFFLLNLSSFVTIRPEGLVLILEGAQRSPASGEIPIEKFILIYYSQYIDLVFLC